MKLQTLDELKDRFYGPKGSGKRDQLDRELDVLRIGILIRNARKESKLTQAELAERIGKKRAFISRVENDGSNLTIATLLDIVEKGLGKKRTSSTISASMGMPYLKPKDTTVTDSFSSFFRNVYFFRKTSRNSFIVSPVVSRMTSACLLS